VGFVNLVGRDNGFGLSRDARLLGAALTANGDRIAVNRIGSWRLGKFAERCRVRASRVGRRSLGGVREFDANLMLEHVWPEHFADARCNVLVPNPEWCLPRDVATLQAVDCVFVKTWHAGSIFARLGCRVAYTGFTSEDRFDPAVSRQRSFLHVAGRSQTKNTDVLLALWRAHPNWPRLTVVQDPRAARRGPTAPNIDHRIERLKDADLRTLQNAHRVHLCPSQTEGFGHYLVEAMSVSAVAVTLDAPPMHELVTPKRGVLVPAVESGRQHLATIYAFDPAQMAAAVENLIEMTDRELDALGQAARDWFKENDHAFASRLGAALAGLRS
jgi:hypothetical protein